MEQNQFASNPLHQKGKHLNFEERVVIQTRLRDDWSFTVKSSGIWSVIYSNSEK